MANPDLHPIFQAALAPFTATDVTIVFRSADAAEWVGIEDAFDAFNEASATYPEWAFRLHSGGEPGRYRIEALKFISPPSTGWLATA